MNFEYIKNDGMFSFPRGIHSIGDFAIFFFNIGIMCGICITLIFK